MEPPRLATVGDQRARLTQHGGQILAPLPLRVEQTGTPAALIRTDPVPDPHQPGRRRRRLLLLLGRGLLLLLGGLRLDHGQLRAGTLDQRRPRDTAGQRDVPEPLRRVLHLGVRLGVLPRLVVRGDLLAQSQRRDHVLHVRFSFHSRLRRVLVLLLHGQRHAAPVEPRTQCGAQRLRDALDLGGLARVQPQFVA